MNRNIEFKGFEPHQRIRKLIDQLTSKVEKNTKIFSPELVHLRVRIEQNSAKTLYTASITLDLPGKKLAAREEQHDEQAAMRAAFTEIERQLKKYKANLRQEHWKRPERREEIREMKAEAASSVAAGDKRAAYFALVTPHLDRLNHFVQHLIGYGEAVGDL